MDTTRTIGSTVVQDGTTIERTSDRELVVTRTVDGPARLVFRAWTEADLLRQWWVPKSFQLDLVSCETDPRADGQYKLVFAVDGSTMEFFGRYLEVTPPSRLVWTNEEGEGEATVTTVTFEETGGRTLVTLRDLYPSKEALDEGSGSTFAMPETLGQLDELLASMGSTAAS